MKTEPQIEGKPPFRIPSTAEIRAIPKPLTAVSTFVGGGGSDLGLEWAGFSVKWANEFDASARQSYRANFPDHILDGRDIRDVTGPQILDITGLGRGQIDVLNGSPPCQAFSMAGKRDRDWGDKAVGLDKGRRKDDLFFEFARLLKELQPRAFMAENVKGLVIGKAKGYFVEIHRALQEAGYRVSARVLDAQWLGVPQARQRLIFMGFRDDLGIDPAAWFPKPLPYNYSVLDALPWIGRTSGAYHFRVEETVPAVPSRQREDAYRDPVNPDRPAHTVTVADDHFVEMIVGNDAFKPRWGATSQPSPTILAGHQQQTSGQIRQGPMRRKFTIGEVKRICGFPDDYQLVGSYAEQWKRCGNAVPPPMAMAVAAQIARALTGLSP